MAKGTRLPEETKIEIARRAKNEDLEMLATEYNISVSSVKEYRSKFGNRRPRVKRSVIHEENTGVSQNGLIRELREEAAYWRDQFLKLYRKINEP